jgi:hypothetical protein
MGQSSVYLAQACLQVEVAVRLFENLACSIAALLNLIAAIFLFGRMLNLSSMGEVLPWASALGSNVFVAVVFSVLAALAAGMVFSRNRIFSVAAIMSAVVGGILVSLAGLGAYMQSDLSLSWQIVILLASATTLSTTAVAILRIVIR